MNIEHIRTPDFLHLNTDIIAPYHVEELVDCVYHTYGPEDASA